MIVDQEPARMIEGEELTKLLDGPCGGGVVRDAAVQNPARTDFHRDEHVKHAEIGRDRAKEIAGDHGFGMIADEGAPALARASVTRIPVQVLANCPRRDFDAELEFQLGLDEQSESPDGAAPQ